MHHVAIMNKSWKMIPKILSGEKTVESRWYVTRRAPWGRIRKDDTVFFKNAGARVTAQARVSRILQFILEDVHATRRIIAKYGKSICLPNPDPESWPRLPRYCVLIFLKNPKAVKKPFQINKKGFGAGAGWITLTDIRHIAVV